MEVGRKKSVGELSSNGGSWRNGSIQLNEDKDQPRPPTYNPEDYAAALKKFSRRAAETKDESGGGAQPNSSPDGEMSLRQFTGIPELLNKLKTDLRVAYPSFVQEFIGDPLDGVTLLLEMLKTIQQSQSNNQAQGRASSALQRRILLDEHACLLCLKYLLRCQDAPRRFAASPAGLFTLAACFMSNANKSRVLALELLTKVCEHPGARGHVSVSEAMSTMRLRFGEPVRFRFLVGMLNGACSELISSGLKFINAFVETSPNLQTKFYIQAELDQAGFNVETLSKTLPNSDIIKEELERWERNYIDVESILIKSEEAVKEVVALREKVAQLESTVTILQEEKLKQIATEKSYRKNLKDLDKHCLKYETDKSISHICIDDNKLVSGTERGRRLENGNGDVTPAEDEGISSSEHEDIEIEERVPVIYELLSLQNDTIVVKNDTRSLLANDDPSKGDDITVDEVMNDFQRIINDAEKQNNITSRFGQNVIYSQTKNSKANNNHNRNVINSHNNITNGHNNKSNIDSKNDKIIIRNYVDDSKSAGNSTSTSEALILEEENDIVPSYILPQPPSRSRSLYLPEKDYDDINPFFDDEDDDDDRSGSHLNSTINLEADFNDDNDLMENIENLHADKYQFESNYNKLGGKPIDNHYNYYMFNGNKSKNEDLCEKNNKQNDKRNRKLQNGEVAKAKIKRSDTFHNIHNEIQQKFYDVSAMINRRGSFDGLFYNNKTSNHRALCTSKSSASSAIHDQDAKRLKSKSLDRIEDGIERFIDIVMTSDDTVYDDCCDSNGKTCNEKRNGKSDCCHKSKGSNINHRVNAKRVVGLPNNKKEKMAEKPIYFNDVKPGNYDKYEKKVPLKNESKYSILKDSNKSRKDRVYTNVRVNEKTRKQYFGGGDGGKSKGHPDASSANMEYVMPKIYVGSEHTGLTKQNEKSRNETNQSNHKHGKASESEFILKRGNKIAGMYSNQYQSPDYDQVPPSSRQKGPVINRSPSNLVKNMDSINNYRRSITRLADTPSGLY